MTFLVFPAVGVGALWAAAEMPAGSGTGAWIFGGSFIAASLVPALLLVAGRRKRARAHRLVTEGATGIGTVTGINDTGVTINRNPRITLRLQIVPEDGSAPFEAEKTITASRVDLPRRGQRFPVWYDRDDRSQLALGTDVDSTASPEVRRLFEKAGIAGQATPEPAATGTDELLDRVTRLYELRQAGALTEAEFQDQKARILGAG